ncbi:NAB region 1 [Paramuricea clavata]|uniref:NAB region 1 n=1 Tax=Paramuricea clavata TaxID=317549 RepID=A0A7D9D7B3_PARCT|nr:NAB region 1 [Paramuricea clavata]
MASEIREFLEKNNLSQYFDNFIDQGYDDMDQILSMASNPLELNSLMKDVAMFEKPGPKKRFFGAVQILASKVEHRGAVESPETGLNVSESNQGSANDVSICEYQNSRPGIIIITTMLS